jgi:hypothetical protein
MAGTGPAPKPDSQRRRRNTPTHGPERVVEPDGETRGPALVGEWPDLVHEWHETWRRSPQAALFEDTDWTRLQMIAPLVKRAFEGSIAAMTEVRMSESLLGATMTDRLKARVRVDRPDDGDETGATLHALPSAREDLAARLK